MKNKFLKTLFVSNGLFVFASSLLVPIFAIFTKNFNTNLVFIGSTVSISLLSSTFFLLGARSLGDKIQNKSTLIIVSFLIRACVWVSYIFVGNIFQILLLQVLLGLGEALGSPSFDVLVAEHLDEGKHVKDYATWKLIVNFAAALGAILGSVIVSLTNFDVLFALMALLALCSAVLFYFGIQKNKFIG